MDMQEASPKKAPNRRKSTAPSTPDRELFSEQMLADRWLCSVSRLQRWRTTSEGPAYLKIVGKVLYRLKDIQAFEDECLIVAGRP